MKQMLRAPSVEALLLPLVLSLAAATAGALAGQPLAVTLDESGPHIPSHVSYAWTPKGLNVKGRIEKRYDRYGRILGHPEIELLDNQGRVIARHSGALSHFVPRRKDPDWATFSTLIPDAPAETAGIRVSHALGGR